MPRGMWGAFLLYGSPNGAYNTIDINVSAYNTVHINVGAYNSVVTNVGTSHTICVRSVAEHCSRWRTGYVPGTVF